MNDKNGPVAKLYDARTGGGVFVGAAAGRMRRLRRVPRPRHRRRHPAPVRTIAGAPGNEKAAKAAAKKCKKGFVKKHGKCVRKKPRRRGRRDTTRAGGCTDDREVDHSRDRGIGGARARGCRLAGAGPGADHVVRNDKLRFRAGGHPDLTTSFTLDEPGVKEAAMNVIFNAPEGVFGNINAVTNCIPLRLRA